MSNRRRLPHDPSSARRGAFSGFTLIELLVVLSIISLVMAILLPSLSGARRRGRATVCLANLKTLGQGLQMYATDHRDQLVPGRLPKLNDDHWRSLVLGGWKYRPTFLAIMGTNVGIPPFDDPLPSRTLTDRFGQPGDRQDYSSKAYVCPSVSDWTDERNGSYGYNYQFLGNSRLRDASDPRSFKNWPVSMSRISSPSTTVAVADCVGTAAAFPRDQRTGYVNNSRDAQALGNEGFNLDPPRLDLVHGEIADRDGYRSAADDRHLGRSQVLWVDTHASPMTLDQLGYRVETDGVVAVDGNNSLWTGTGRDVAWTQP